MRGLETVFMVAFLLFVGPTRIQIRYKRKCKISEFKSRGIFCFFSNAFDCRYFCYLHLLPHSKDEDKEKFILFD